MTSHTNFSQARCIEMARDTGAKEDLYSSNGQQDRGLC